MRTTWQQALDAFFDHLADVREAAERGRPTSIVPLVAPHGRGPLPPLLWQFAEALLAEADELQRGRTADAFAA